VSLARHRSVRQDILSNAATTKDLLSHLPKSSTGPYPPPKKFSLYNCNLFENKLPSLLSSDPSLQFPRIISWITRNSYLCNDKIFQPIANEHVLFLCI